MIVVDSSALFEAMIETRSSAAIIKRIFATDETLHAPHLIDIEIANVLRRYVRTNELSPIAGRQALDDLTDIPIRRYPHTILMPRIWELRNNLSPYDAAYLALAEMLDAPLITRDAAIASSTGHGVRIELI